MWFRLLLCFGIVSHHSIALLLPRDIPEGGSVGSALEVARARGPPPAKVLGRLKAYYAPPIVDSGKDAGTWLVLHACQASAEDWFGGLPEESTITLELQKRGFGLLALQSTSGICWEAGEEVLIAEALAAFGPRPSKLYGLGISSGGEALSLLVVERRAVFDGLIFDVSPASAFAQLQVPGAFPPTAFIYMPQDKTFATQGAIDAAKGSLERAGARVALYPTWPQPVDTAELCGRLPQLGPYLCDTIVKALFVTHSLLEQREGGKYYFKFIGAVKGVTASSADYANNALRMLQPKLNGMLTDRLLRALMEENKRFEGVHTPIADHFPSALDFVLSNGATEPILSPQAAFAGQWTDEADPGKEIIRIKGDTVHWSGGEETKVEIISKDTFSTKLNGKAYTAQLIPSGYLKWDFFGLWIRLNDQTALEKGEAQAVTPQCTRSKAGLSADLMKKRQLCVPESYAAQLQKDSTSVSFTAFLCDCLFTEVSVCLGGPEHPHLVGYDGAMVNLTVPANAPPSQWLKVARSAICAERSSTGGPGYGAVECAACGPWDPFVKK